MSDSTMTQEHRDFLNQLRRRGTTNMYGAGAFLQAEFGLDRRDASAILSQWMAATDPEEEEEEEEGGDDD